MGLDKPLPQQYWIGLSMHCMATSAVPSNFGVICDAGRERPPGDYPVGRRCHGVGGDPGVGGGLLMFRLRSTVFEPVADMVSIALL